MIMRSQDAISAVTCDQGSCWRWTASAGAVEGDCRIHTVGLQSKPHWIPSRLSTTSHALRHALQADKHRLCIFELTWHFEGKSRPSVEHTGAKISVQMHSVPGGVFGTAGGASCIHIYVLDCAASKLILSQYGPATSSFEQNRAVLMIITCRASGGGGVSCGGDGSGAVPVQLPVHCSRVSKRLPLPWQPPYANSWHCSANGEKNL